eukprot:2868382-Rhodomonas_salina.1
MLLSYVLAPIAFGTSLASFDDFVIGGRLIGLAKPGGDIWPILIGDADRRLVARAMMQSCSEELATYFLTAHPRVVQCGVGVPDGAAKAYHAITTLLPTFPNGHTPSPADSVNPVVLLSLDATNTFNCISRVAMFDAITGKASKWYNDGTIPPGATFDDPYTCLTLAPFLPFLLANYGRPAQLGYSNRDSPGLLFVSGSTGSQQGDPPFSAMFSLGLHPGGRALLEAGRGAEKGGGRD